MAVAREKMAWVVELAAVALGAAQPLARALLDVALELNPVQMAHALAQTTVARVLAPAAVAPAMTIAEVEPSLPRALVEVVLIVAPGPEVQALALDPAEVAQTLALALPAAALAFVAVFRGRASEVPRGGKRGGRGGETRPQGANRGGGF